MFHLVSTAFVRHAKSISFSFKINIFHLILASEITSGLYVRYDSFCPRHHKLATIKSLATRAKRICAPPLLQDELDSLRTIFTDNGFPINIIKKCVVFFGYHESLNLQFRLKHFTQSSVSALQPNTVLVFSQSRFNSTTKLKSFAIRAASLGALVYTSRTHSSTDTNNSTQITLSLRGSTL